MVYFLSISMLGVCCYTIFKMVKVKSPIWMVLGTTGGFSIGYYVLPIYFKEYSALNNIRSEDISIVLFMALIFFLSIIIGAFVHQAKTGTGNPKALSLDQIDKILTKNYKLFYVISLIIWTGHYFTADLTSYSSENLDAYFHQRGSFVGLIAAFSNFSLSVIAVSTAIAIANQDKIKYLMIIVYISIIVLLLVTGQRLAVITPIFMLVIAFSLFANKAIGLKMIGFGILFLIIISPLMVFIREFQAERGKSKAIVATKAYQSSENAITSGFVSILERADLLSVMVKLKEYYDFSDNFNQSQYFYSVACAYVPRVIFPTKPYALSDDGTMFGETSVQAWQLIAGSSTGSLSAFGAITAYREGGWLWVVVNGLVTGYVLAVICQLLANGSHVSKLLFTSIFVSLCIKNVPISLSYLVVFIAPTVLLIIALSILNKFLKTL